MILEKPIELSSLILGNVGVHLRKLLSDRLQIAPIRHKSYPVNVSVRDLVLGIRSNSNSAPPGALHSNSKLLVSSHRHRFVKLPAARSVYLYRRACT